MRFDTELNGQVIDEGPLRAMRHRDRATALLLLAIDQGAPVLAHDAAVCAAHWARMADARLKAGETEVDVDPASIAWLAYYNAASTVAPWPPMPVLTSVAPTVAPEPVLVEPMPEEFGAAEESGDGDITGFELL